MVSDPLRIERIPVELNLGQPEQIVGWASIVQDPENKQISIAIVLRDEMGIAKLEDLVEIFDIKAIGFAGVKRRPTDGR
jgi:hypothetical protein